MKPGHRVLWTVILVLTAGMSIAMCRQTFGQFPLEPESNAQTRDAERGRRGDQGSGPKGETECAAADRTAVFHRAGGLGRKQLHTIAFSGLAFITGDFGASTFIPPGKVCDFFGFQYMRDIDAAEKGHNPMFLNRVAGNVLNVLNDEAEEDVRRPRRGAGPATGSRCPDAVAAHQGVPPGTDDRILPAGSDGSNKESVARYVGAIFARDAELSLRRAEVMAAVAASLNDEQKACLGKMKFGDFSTWPAIDERGRLKRPRGRGGSRLFNVAYMTYASEFFSWTAGREEADVYFCPSVTAPTSAGST